MKHICDNIEKQWSSALAIVNGQHNLPGGMTAICASPHYSTIIQCMLLLEQISKQLFREYPFKPIDYSYDALDWTISLYLIAFDGKVSNLVKLDHSITSCQIT